VKLLVKRSTRLADDKCEVVLNCLKVAMRHPPNRVVVNPQAVDSLPPGSVAQLYAGSGGRSQSAATPILVGKAEHVATGASGSALVGATAGMIHALRGILLDRRRPVLVKAAACNVM